MSELRDCDCGHWTGCDAKVTDEALLGELVKRGVLRLSDEWRSSYDGSRRYVSDRDPAREPVGSVEGEG